MRTGNSIVVADAVTKFFEFVRVRGWFHNPNATLTEVRVRDPFLVSFHSKVGLAHGGVRQFGDNKGFEIRLLRKTADEGMENIRFMFVSDNGSQEIVSLAALCQEQLEVSRSTDFGRRFVREVNKSATRLLDIGGRARSGLNRKDYFTVPEYVVLDILPGENVDVVGDAHQLSKYFPPESFDAFYSVSVFEHLMMPWAVVPQINRVLKSGGIGLITTHQALGMHDMPWDFWRFSDTAWDALFNVHTGFEIVERVIDTPMHLLPFIWRPSMNDAEKAAGFEVSAVWVKKIGPCQMTWELTPEMINETAYPNNDHFTPPDTFTMPKVRK